RVQVSGRFICEQKLRSGDDRAGNADELLLTSGELRGIQIFLADDLETVEHVSYECGALACAVPAIRQRYIEILVNREIVEQMILLKNETNLLVAQCRSLFRFQMMRCGSVEKVFTGPAVIVHSQNVQQRRFACAGRAHNRDEVAFLNLQIDLAQNVKELFLRQRIAAFDMLKLNHIGVFIRNAARPLDRQPVPGARAGNRPPRLLTQATAKSKQRSPDRLRSPRRANSPATA